MQNNSSKEDVVSEAASLGPLSDGILSALSFWRTQAIKESEYADLFAQILGKLRRKVFEVSRFVVRSGVPGHRSELQLYIQSIVCFLHELQSNLNKSGSSDQLPYRHVSGRTWPLGIVEMTDLVATADGLLQGRLHELYEFGKPEASHRPAPPQLYMNVLEDLEDRPWPPKQIGKWIDMSELRLWIDHCDKHHASHCQLSLEGETSFTHHPKWLIDVERLCLVPGLPRQRYAALSYVWGMGTPFQTVKRNVDFLQQAGSMVSFLQDSSNQIPPGPGLQRWTPVIPTTVRHVIKVAQLLGIGFLWVDTLCIIQDDEEEKQEQLRFMGSIYANACVTIVAAEGVASRGLRGIEHLSSLPMSRETRLSPYRRTRLHQHVQHLHSELQRSTWCKRAWTFQEQIYSRRLLIFGDSHVAWECHCSVWFEGIEVAEGQCQKNTEVIAQGFSFRRPANFEDYASHVAQYNHRALTYPEDALYAFSGILHTLSTAFVGGFIGGLPAIFFEAGLLWYSETPMTKRQALRQGHEKSLPPTWSWARWEGPISFPDPDMRPLADWQCWESTKKHWQPVKPPEMQQLTNESGELAMAENAIDPENEEDNMSPFPIKYICPLLRTRTLRSFFPFLEPPQDTYAILRGQSGDCAGVLRSCESINRITKAHNNDGLCEVIAISEAVQHGEAVLNVLWIERKDEVAYRKGVGRVYKSAWLAQHHERVPVILG
ncbi:heterokaryon incompatibility [Diaporthe sp. PMI_573]|nr:heterokaryon incompatibility [Diaporthaceae sp. PMI_573]